MNFVKVGKHRLNLDTVSDVYELGDGSVRVYYNYAISGDYNAAICSYDTLRGDQAKFLLAWIDGDDETVDALYDVVNGGKKPAGRSADDTLAEQDGAAVAGVDATLAHMVKREPAIAALFVPPDTEES